MSKSTYLPRNSVPTSNNLPGVDTSGSFWTVITAMMLVAFILYITANGLLQRWLQLLVFSTPQAITPAGTSGAVNNPASSGGNSSASPSSAPAQSSSSPFDFFGGFLKSFMGGK